MGHNANTNSIMNESDFVGGCRRLSMIMGIPHRHCLTMTRNYYGASLAPRPPTRSALQLRWQIVGSG